MTALSSSSKSCASPEPRQPSERLRALLIYSKRPERQEGAYAYSAVASVLGELFHPSMTLVDSMHHLVLAYEEVLMEPRYCVGSGPNPALELVLSPIKGLASIDFMGPSSVDTAYSVKQYYDAMACYIFGQLSITRVDWLDVPLT